MFFPIYFPLTSGKWVAMSCDDKLVGGIDLEIDLKVMHGWKEILKMRCAEFIELHFTINIIMNHGLVLIFALSMPGPLRIYFDLEF